MHFATYSPAEGTWVVLNDVSGGRLARSHGASHKLSKDQPNCSTELPILPQLC